MEHHECGLWLFMPALRPFANSLRLIYLCLLSQAMLFDGILRALQPHSILLVRSQHLTPTPKVQGPSPAQTKFGKSGDLEIQNFWIHKMEKKTSEIQIRSAQILARSGLVGKKSSRTHLGPSQAIFPWTEQV